VTIVLTAVYNIDPIFHANRESFWYFHSPTPPVFHSIYGWWLAIWPNGKPSQSGG